MSVSIILRRLFANRVGQALLCLSLLGTAAIPALADRDDHNERCERSVHKAEQNLEKAVRRHGERSRQAEQRRHQLEEARERCHMGRDHDGDHDHH